MQKLCPSCDFSLNDKELVTTKYTLEKNSKWYGLSNNDDGTTSYPHCRTAFSE